MSGGLPIDQLLCGDAVELSREKLPDDSIDGIATDPPYGLEFMGEEWDKFDKSLMHHRDMPKGTYHNDSTFFNMEVPKPRYKAGRDYQSWTTSWAKEALRVLKPGASMLVMGGTRTYHRMVCGVEDAGFLIKDTLAWCYNSGFPKAQDLGIVFDKQECRKRLEQKLGRKPTKAEFKESWGEFRKIVGKLNTPFKVDDAGKRGTSLVGSVRGDFSKQVDEKGYRYTEISLPITPEAKFWNGWKIGGLKPSYEPVLWAVKPPEGSYTDNVLKHGVGAINVDGCRIPYESEDDIEGARVGFENVGWKHSGNKKNEMTKLQYDLANQKGRYPANMIRTDRFHDGYDRFYFIPKASREERDEGLDGMPRTSEMIALRNKVCAKCKKHYFSGDVETRCVCENPEWKNGRLEPANNIHPTVKPVALMEHLIKLVTREGQIVLDPFVGSGTTCIAARKLLRHYIGFDNNPEYIEIARHRLAAIPRPLEVYA